MPHNDVYTIRATLVNVTTAITLLQVTAASNRGFEITRASLTQRGSTTSEQDEVAVVRKTANATVSVAVSGGTSGNVFPQDPLGLAVGNGQIAQDLVLGVQSTGFLATAEGSDGDYLIREGFNVLNGWLYMPLPEDREYVPPGGTIAIKIPSPPGSGQNWMVSMRIQMK